jgi:hyperosmotically inducible protein
MSVFGAAFLILLLVAALGFTYMVATRGWEQTKTDLRNSFDGVTYAMKETSGDAALTAKVKTALSLNKRVPVSSINVDSENGVVTLRGEVPTDDSRNAAQQIAQDTPGVQQVNNHLYVTSPVR